MPVRPVLGPLLRGVWPTGANFWVEIDRPAVVHIEVSPEGRSAWQASQQHTVQVGRRHFALVTVAGLKPGAWYTWRASVDADGSRAVLPEHRVPALRGLVFRTLDERTWRGRYRFAHASCRKVRHGAEGSGTGGGAGEDVLDRFAGWLSDAAAQRESEWPRFFLLTGDQIYADEIDDFIIERILEKRRRFGQPPLLRSMSELGQTLGRAGRRGVHPSDFEEFALTYEHSWAFPGVQQVLANVPNFMMFDDHEITDDWNITRAWQDQARRGPWRAAIAGGLAAYWLYQGWGNLDEETLNKDKRHAVLLDASRSGTDALPRLLQLIDVSLGAPQTLSWYYSVRAPFPLRVADTRTERQIPPGSNIQAQRQARIMSSTQLDWLTEPSRKGAGWAIAVTPGPFLLWPLVTVAGVAFRLGRGNDSASPLARVLGFGAAALSTDILTAKQREQLLRDMPDLEFWAVFFDSYSHIVRLAQQLHAARRTLLLITGDLHVAFTISATPSGAPRAAPAARPPTLLQLVGSSMQNPPTGKKRTAVTYAGNAARRASFGGLDFEYLPFASENFFFDSNIALVDLVKDQRGVWLQEKYLTASRKGGLEPSRVMRAPAAPMRSIEPR